MAREIRKNFGIIHCRTPCRTLQLPAAAPVVSSVRSSSPGSLLLGACAFSQGVYGPYHLVSVSCHGGCTISLGNKGEAELVFHPGDAVGVTVANMS